MALKKLVIFHDVHAPYHSRAAWNLLCQVGKAFKPDIVACLGDWLDCAPLSVHVNNPVEVQSLDAELAAHEQQLSDVEAWGASQHIWCLGNHEHRFFRLTWEKVPQLATRLSLEQLYRPGRLSAWTLVPYRQDFKLGKLYLTHDCGHAGKYSTYHTLNTYQHSVVHGHAHRLSYVVENNAVGESKVGAQFGWLGDPAQVSWQYRAKVAPWSQGFGVGYLDSTSGRVYLTPIPIVQDTCVVEGRLYVASSASPSRRPNVSRSRPPHSRRTRQRG